MTDDVVRLELHKPPAPTQSVVPINMYIRLFIRCCDYLLL